MKNRFIKNITDFFRLFDAINKHKASDLYEWELEELENIFAVLVLGMFIGIPSPPVHITAELLPYMEHEMQIMLKKINTAHDPLGELFSMLDVG